MPLPLRVATWLALTAAVGIVSDRAFRRWGVPSAVVERRDVVYRTVDGRRLSLDVYSPPGGTAGESGPRPAILAVHGGSWIGGSKRLYRPSLKDPHPTAVRLAKAGYVVVAADYRLARPGVPGWPAALDDLREAVRWIRRHAPDLGVDPARIAALGQSAGAHLAAMLGTSPGDESARVQAVVDFYGPSDLQRLPFERNPNLAHDPVHLFLGVENSASRIAHDASPIHHVHRDAAPTLIIHGTDDPWVPIRQSEDFARTLEAMGIAHQFIRVEGARHGFDAEVLEPDRRDLLPEIFAFLENVWNDRAR
jgi:acetyl esterase/lipase